MKSYAFKPSSLTLTPHALKSVINLGILIIKSTTLLPTALPLKNPSPKRKSFLILIKEEANIINNNFLRNHEIE